MFGNDSRRFSFSTRSLGHTMFSFAGNDLVVKLKRRESFPDTIQSELNSFTLIINTFLWAINLGIIHAEAIILHIHSTMTCN